jgi:hypothetical protein
LLFLRVFFRGHLNFAPPPCLEAPDVVVALMPPRVLAPEKAPPIALAPCHCSHTTLRRTGANLTAGESRAAPPPPLLRRAFRRIVAPHADFFWGGGHCRDGHSAPDQHGTARHEQRPRGKPETRCGRNPERVWEDEGSNKDGYHYWGSCAPAGWLVVPIESPNLGPAVGRDGQSNHRLWVKTVCAVSMTKEQILQNW